MESEPIKNDQQIAQDIRDNETFNCAEDVEADNTIHGFNISHPVNTTVIEHTGKQDMTEELELTISKNTSCEGSDSGVEVIENPEACTLDRIPSSQSANLNEYEVNTPGQSCDSSIISCYSNYEEVYNSLVRKNSTLLEEYKLINGDGTSEGGSESSSTISQRQRKQQINYSKKKVSLNDTKMKCTNTPNSRTRNTESPRNSLNLRTKSIDRCQVKTPTTKTATPKQSANNKKPILNSLPLSASKIESKKNYFPRVQSISRTPVCTPTNGDGRWPSVHSKAAPLMSRSVRSSFMSESQTKTKSELKTIDKYGTLPRRKREHSVDNIKDFQTKRPLSRENSVNRASTLKKKNISEMMPSKAVLQVSKRKTLVKTKIYHESSIQTALTLSDIDNALSGISIKTNRPQDVEKCDQEIQADLGSYEFEKLEEEHVKLSQLYNKLITDYEEQKEKLEKLEEKLKYESLEKDGLKEELRQNTERVLAILGEDQNFDNEATESSGDSLMVLENKFHNVSQVIINQEKEISTLNEHCRTLQQHLDKSLNMQKILMQQQKELEAESIELQEFMQAEKSTLTDALRDSEVEVRKLRKKLSQGEQELESKLEDYKNICRLSERRRQEIMSLQSRLGTLEMRCRDLLVQQGGSMSGAAVALAALISRLSGLVEELIASYEISEQELDDVIYHNEVYSNSSSSSDTSPDETSLPMRGSFISAIINAIKNAAAQSPFSGNKDMSRDNLCVDNSDSTEMLDSETEPCLMMEHVLEDVVVPDGHTHNMISSGHMLNSRLTHSGSLNNLSHAIINRQMSEQTSFSLTESLNASYTSDISSYSDVCSSMSVVDQVITVDNLITRLLKVIRIIQIESDDNMTQLQHKYDQICDETIKEKKINKDLAMQLEEWEKLGSSLKQDTKKLLHQLSKKNTELEEVKGDLNHQRKEIEKLSQDVCDLSTALSKSELQLREKEGEVASFLKTWEESNELPSKEVLGRLVASQHELPKVKDNLLQTEKQLNELRLEHEASKQVLSENWKEAVLEAKKQYRAIDNALETLHSIQSVVQQCPPLAKMQRDLEETNFQSASSNTIVVPPDCNANAALRQAMANLEIASPINSTA